MNAESLWPRGADLSLVGGGCEYARLHAVLTSEFERITTHVRLVGAGAAGLGGGISIFQEDGTPLHERGPAPPRAGGGGRRPGVPLGGEWTLAAFCDHVATLELWPQAPEWEGALRYRTWAFE